MFLYSVRDGLKLKKFFFYIMGVQFFSTVCWKRQSFLHWIDIAHQEKKSFVHVCVYLVLDSVFSIDLLYIFMRVPQCLDYCNCIKNLFQSVLAVLGSLYFHMKFITTLSTSVKKKFLPVGILIGIVSTLYINLGKTDILTVLILLTCEHKISLILLVCGFSKQCFVVFSAQIFHIF